MNINPFVSIVIPVYNGADYLHEAIDSALEQTYAACEVLVINDGSSDGGATELIARSYGERIRYFSKENGGVASALNMGLREMRGEYFSWLSHDDVYLPGKIAAQIAFIRHMELENCAVYSDYGIIDAQGCPLGDVALPVVAPEDMFAYLYNAQTLHGCTLLIPRDALLDEGGFPEDRKTTQDYELWLRLCRRVPFVQMQQKLLLARRHDAQGSRIIPDHVREVCEFYVDHLPELLTLGRPESSGLDRVANEERLLRESMLCRMKADQIHAGLAVMAMAWARLPGLRRKWNFFCMLAVGLVYYAERRTPGWMRPVWNMLKPQRPKPIASFQREDRLDFIEIYRKNGFGNTESASGSGSTLLQTRVLRRLLPQLLHEYDIVSLLDAPCGDFHWMRHVNLEGIKYVGADIVPQIVERNKRLYETEMRNFILADISHNRLPVADCMLCRDCLAHLSYADIRRVLKNLRTSSITWLLTTTYPDVAQNVDLNGGVWRPLNLCEPPFDFSEPVTLLDEKNTVGYGLLGRKCLGLWRVSVLNDI